jgi:hypothetical protein
MPPLMLTLASNKGKKQIAMSLCLFIITESERLMRGHFKCLKGAQVPFFN